MTPSSSGLAATSPRVPTLQPAPPGFATLGLIAPLCRAVAAAGYQMPTPIQARAIPPLLAGRDVLGCAQTGTGKTAAFALPILDRLARTRHDVGRHGPRALILAPSRELATQIADAFDSYGRHLSIDCGVVVGGVSQGPQIDALRGGADVIVATPGRLLDLIGQGHAPLAAVEVFGLDEADRMLDMGFIEPIRRIVAGLPSARQNLMFSATMPRELRKLADSLLDDPVDVTVANTAERVSQCVLHVRTADKRALLGAVLQDPAMTRVLLFVRTKHGADRLVDQLGGAGETVAAIHGDKSQGARHHALAEFKAGQTRVLVATDLAARGIDVDGITHVINFEIPLEPETYVHRVGRTARAGAAGVALSFCDDAERSALRAIERLIQRPLAVVEAPPFAEAGRFASAAGTTAGGGHGKG
jgi:ATP-dependent RNA helicase RhlE